ncbi:MAG: thioredoxin-dependent thiol peroxidase [Roseivirga sp.]|nr:thioredoxin-dependent thiol peroxidase [Roseivirga sp.]
MPLQIGDQAPAFEGVDQNGSPIKLSDFAGKKLVLYFYPKDNTPGCTATACNLRDNYEVLLKSGYAVVGVSSDSERKHQNFIKKYDLPFPLIADTDQKVHNLFGTWGEKQMFGRKYMGTIRTTFVIDEQGKIEEIVNKVKTDNHTSQILK